MKWLLSMTLFFSMQSIAEVSSSEVSAMIDQMVEKNVISKSEAEKAKARMVNMTPEQWSKINQQAQAIAGRSPASASVPSENKIEEVHSIDLDSAQFKQIQSDMGKIVPSYKD
jgi:DNA-binding MarR family transcriptional regulator